MLNGFEWLTSLFKHWNNLVILCSLPQHVGLCILCDTYFGIVFVDVLVVGHLHQAVPQVVIGKDEETGLKVAVDLFQILKTQ